MFYTTDKNEKFIVTVKINSHWARANQGGALAPTPSVLSLCTPFLSVTQCMYFYLPMHVFICMYRYVSASLSVYMYVCMRWVYD